MPDFPPIRAGGRAGLLPWGLRRRRGALAGGLAVSAAALAVTAAHGAPAPRPAAAAPRGPAPAALARGPAHAGAPALVRAPVRIADAAAVALLRPGDRVDVLAGARVVATRATVTAVPGGAAPAPSTTEPAEPAAVPDRPAVPDSPAAGGGALVVLSVPRPTAAALSGAAMSSPLAVALC